MTDPRATVLRYHEATNNSPESVAAGRPLDWANQPLPYKIYSTLEPIPLPTPIEPTGYPAIRALLEPAEPPPTVSPTIDLATIARLCVLSNGIIRVRRYPGGEIAFRAAGTTGALYHQELYLACTDLPDLEAGLYHFGAHDNALRRLRSGDYRNALVAATAGEPSIAHAPLVVIATSTFWRNAWKYGARAWRHTFWDTGTVLANLLALARASELTADVVLGFVDADVNSLLDVDAKREASVCLVGVGRTDEPPPPAPDAPPLDLPTVPLSRHEVRYPLIEEAHTASSFDSPDEVLEWRARIGGLQIPPLPEPTGPLTRLDPPPIETLPADPIEEVIRRRGSARSFAPRPLQTAALATLLEATVVPVPADFTARPEGLSELFLIINAVGGLDPGAYLRHVDGIGVELLRRGDLRAAAAWVALGQDPAAEAAANLYWLADLDALVDALGPRAYRAAQLDAGIRAGRTWLTAYAVRLGATGLTFFDDEVIRLFGPPAAGRGVMFLLVVGHRERRER